MSLLRQSRLLIEKNARKSNYKWLRSKNHLNTPVFFDLCLDRCKPLMYKVMLNMYGYYIYKKGAVFYHINLNVLSFYLTSFDFSPEKPAVSLMLRS